MTRDLSYDVAFKGFETTRRETTSATKLKDHATMANIEIMEALGAIRFLTDAGVIRDTAVAGTTRFLLATGEMGFV